MYKMYKICKVFGDGLDIFYPFIPMYVVLGLFQMQVCLIWQNGDPLWTYASLQLNIHNLKNKWYKENYFLPCLLQLSGIKRNFLHGYGPNRS